MLRKIDPRKGFLGNTKEVLRRDLSIGEIRRTASQQQGGVRAGGALHLLDLEAMRVTWSTASPVVGLRNIYLAPDKQHLYIELGGA